MKCFKLPFSFRISTKELKWTIFLTFPVPRGNCVKLCDLRFTLNNDPGDQKLLLLLTTVSFKLTVAYLKLSLFQT